MIEHQIIKDQASLDLWGKQWDSSGWENFDTYGDLLWDIADEARIRGFPILLFWCEHYTEWGRHVDYSVVALDDLHRWQDDLTSIQKLRAI